MRLAQAEGQMYEPPYLLDAARRRVVLGQIKETCERRNWALIAAHVRANHVHVIVQSDVTADDTMDALKAYASRALNRSGLDGARRKRWTRHGSTAFVES
jgi:REP element-mobilizing transposase RayT